MNNKQTNIQSAYQQTDYSLQAARWAT